MQSNTNKGQKYTNSRTKVDPDAPKSNQDCKVCNRRRIKCDRGLPTCGKCKSRNLECPGYGLVLKWGQGVASRGKLAGKSLPIRHPEHAVATATSSTSSSPTRSNTSTSPRQKVTKVPTVKQEKPQHFTNVNVMRVDVGHGELDAEFEEDLDLGMGGCCGGPNPSHGGWEEWLASNGGIEFFDNKPSMAPSPPNSVYSLDFNSPLPDLDLNFDLAPQLPAILANSSVRELLHHYDQSIAPLMVWIDSPTNPWRRLMVPLAMQSPTLLLALLAVSAQHLSAQSGGHHPTFAPASLKYRDTALHLITNRLKIESLGIDHQDPALHLANKIDSDATLAAIIMLCNYEMVDAHTNAWRTHLDAARTMIKLRGGASRMASDNDPTTAFLLNQFFVLDVFASTTTFSADDGLDIEVQHFEPTGGKEEMFEDFLKVMHQVTRWERQLSNPERSPPPIPQTDAIQARFEAARQRTLKAAANLTAALPQRQKDEFAHLINAYHHSGLLYSWRSLYDLNPSHPLIMTSKRELYNSINMIQDTKRYASDIVYPLFIMGTESVGDEVAQEMVEWRMKQAMAVTGFKNSESALDFLDAFWRQGNAGSWVKFAREWGEQGNAFMVC